MRNIVTELTEPGVQIIYLSSEYEMLLYLVISGHIREGGRFWFTTTVVCIKRVFQVRSFLALPDLFSIY